MDMKNWKRNLTIAALLAFIVAGPVGFVITHSVYSFVLMAIGLLLVLVFRSRRIKCDSDSWVHGYRYDYEFDFYSYNVGSKDKGR